MKLFRWLRRLAGLVVVLALLIAAGIGGTLWLTLPPSHQDAKIPGLSAPVDISFDADGIPRIRAQTDADAAAALGFIHARDRMFQMEMMRRAAAGRLSEIAGPVTLPTDRMMRTLGVRRSAVADVEALAPDTRALLDAYARGVNAWIAERGRLAAPEFLLLGTPEPWTPADSLSWAKIMGLWLSGNWRTELSRLALADKLPRGKILELWPGGGTLDGPTAQATQTKFANAAANVLAGLPRFPQPFTLPASASNEWAVDAAHSATGAPLLAGDPHLAFTFPGIWYLARIDTPGETLAGATAPGVPFLVIGRNAHIAWTFTTTGADVQDVFIETPAQPGFYATPDGPKPIAVREEKIAIRGAPDEVLSVGETRHGPIISQQQDGVVLAVSMANLAPGDTAATGLLALNHATSVAEAGAAAAQITAPVQNLLVADKAHIALFVTGRVPIRKSGDGSFPVEGADGAHDWTGFASGAELPHYIDPPGGALVNANERIAPPDFPVFMGRDAFGDWRAQRIRALLARLPRHTAEDFTAMQIDPVSTVAQRLLPTLRAVHPDNDAAARAVALLADWNGAMEIGHPQPLIFNAWMQQFRAEVLSKQGVTQGAGPGDDFEAFVLSPAGAHWCGGDCAPLLTDSLETAVSTLSARFGADPASWRWGAAHQAIFAHPVLRGIPVLGALATLSIAAPGDDSTVDRGGLAGGSLAGGGMEAVHGASYRGVYDLSDLDASRFIATPGQSGNPISSHARDLLTRWRDGATITLGPTPATTTATLRLTP